MNLENCKFNDGQVRIPLEDVKFKRTDGYLCGQLFDEIETKFDIKIKQKGNITERDVDGKTHICVPYEKQ